MIYLISFPILVAVIYCVLWVSRIKRELKTEGWLSKERGETINNHRKLINTQYEEIRILIEGGLYEQEAIQMKYKKIFEQEKKNQEMSRLALNSFHQRYSGLQALGGLPGIFQPRY